MKKLLFALALLLLPSLAHATCTGIFAAGSVCGVSAGASANIPAEIPAALPVSVVAFGAKCDGVTDDHTALQNAFNAGGVIQLPAGKTCFSTTALTVGYNTALVSDTNPRANPATGAVILCSNAVTTTCLSLTGAQTGVTGQGGITMRGIGVGFSGAPGGSAIAIKIATAFNTSLTDVNAFNAAIGIEAVSTGGYGISAHLTRVTTCQIVDAHLVVDGFPELRGSQLRLGCNNDGVNSSDFIRLQNTQGGPSNSPNTVYINNSQFNIGGGQAGCWLHFVGITSLKNEFNFTGNHLEGASAGMCSDAASTQINRLTLTGNFFLDNSGSHNFFNLNVASAVNDWTFTGNQFNGWTGLTLAPSGQINALVMTGNRFNGPPITVTGVSNSTIDLEGNIYSGVALSGAFATSIVKGVNTSGTLTNAATGQVEFPVKLAWTPTLNFGGATTGITYTTQTGNWQINGKTLTLSFNIILSSKGSASGAATITGLPQTCAAGITGTTALYNVSMAALGGAPLAQVSLATVNLYQSGATGVGVLSDANFTATSAIQATIQCLL